MSRVSYFLIFAVGLAVACWVGVGYVALNPLALAVTAIIAAVYVVGSLELYRYQQATNTLERALSGLSQAPESLAEWLSGLDASLRDAVRLRVEGERVGLPGPSLTPYLVGLLVLLGMLGTFLGMVATLRGTGLALENATDLQAIRASLAAPVKGLGFAFGTSVAGVATSAMLGLLSALCRRDRARAVRELDTHVATTLRIYSQAHQREESFKLMQQQAQALPAVAERLEALMATMERNSESLNERLAAGQEALLAKSDARHAAMEERSQALGERLVAGQEALCARNEAVHTALERYGETLSERLVADQEAFHARSELAYSRLLASAEQVYSNLATSIDAVYSRLAASLEDSLKNGMAEAARATSSAITPAMESTFESLARENAALQESIRQSVQRQLEALSSQFEQSTSRNEQSMASMATLWTEALVEHKRVSESLIEAQRRASESLIQESQRANEAMLKTQQEVGTALIHEHRLAGESLVKEQRLAGESLLNEQRLVGETLVKEHKLAGETLVNEHRAAGESLVQEQRQAAQSLIKEQQQAGEALVQTQQSANEALVKAQREAGNSIVQAQREASGSITRAQQAMSESFIKEQQAAREALIEELRGSLEAFTQGFEQRSKAMVDAVAARLGEVAASVAQGWNDAVSHQQSAGEKLAEDNRQALSSAAAALEQHASSLVRTVGESNGELKAALASQDSERLAAWADAFGAMTATLREEWQETAEITASRQREICDTLARTADDMARQAREHASGTIAEIERLLRAASEAPKAAAEVVAEVRDKLSDSMARDNAMLEERSRMLDTLSTLLDAVNHASNEQRTAVDALLSSSSELLDRIGTQVADKVEAEAGKLGQSAAQLSESAIEIAGLGDVFGKAVQQFSESNASLAEHLQRVEETLGKSIARSDEQLAYYVAQAREVIDLSMLSQKQILEELQHLGGLRSGNGEATP